MKNFKKTIFQFSVVVCFFGLFAVQSFAQNYHSPSAAITLIKAELGELPASASTQGFAATQEAPLNLSDQEMEFLADNPRYLVLKHDYLKHLAKAIKRSNDVPGSIASVNTAYDNRVLSQEPQLTDVINVIRTEADLLIQN